MKGCKRTVGAYLVTVMVLVICQGANGDDEVSLNLGGGVTMEFVWVPVEGSDGRATVKIGDQTGAHGKEPVKTETIWGPFQGSGQRFGYYLAKTEVTEAQWALVMGGNKKERTPVTGKTFLEILGFIEALNARTVEFATFPRTADGTPGVIRLPSEAEWEYAARGGSGPDYAANDPYQGDIGRHEVFSSPGSNGRAQEVATFQPNALGLYDMLGNVREFVGGGYSIAGMVGGHLLKGGSYTSEKAEMRSSARTEQSRTAKDGKPSRRLDAGFRVCISSEVFTSLGQAQGIKDQLKADQEKSEPARAEEARLEEARKNAEAAAKAAREERQRLTQEMAQEKSRRALEDAEKIAKEEKDALEALKLQRANQQQAAKDVPFENSLGMKFVPVPGTDVLFSIWDTRVKDFRAYAEASGYRQQGGIYAWSGTEWALDAGASWERPGFQQTAYHPVVGVSWNEAQAFCKWLTEKEQAEGKIAKDKSYRLPTDAEWSTAVGATKFPWGNEWPPPKDAGNYDPSLGVDTYVNTSPVGSFPANRFGLYDMGGNVWQWCEDWYRTSMNESALLEKYAFLKDDGGGQIYRVVRGASWFNGVPEFLWSSLRGLDVPDRRVSGYGFRCVLGSSR